MIIRFLFIRRYDGILKEHSSKFLNGAESGRTVLYLEPSSSLPIVHIRCDLDANNVLN